MHKDEIDQGFKGFAQRRPSPNGPRVSSLGFTLLISGAGILPANCLFQRERLTEVLLRFGSCFTRWSAPSRSPQYYRTFLCPCCLRQILINLELIGLEGTMRRQSKPRVLLTYSESWTPLIKVTDAAKTWADAREFRRCFNRGRKRGPIAAVSTREGCFQWVAVMTRSAKDVNSHTSSPLSWSLISAVVPNKIKISRAPISLKPTRPVNATYPRLCI